MTSDRAVLTVERFPVARSVQQHLTGEEFVSYVLGDLTPELTDTLDAHLARCPTCASDLHEHFEGEAEFSDEAFETHREQFAAALRARLGLPHQGAAAVAPLPLPDAHLAPTAWAAKGQTLGPDPTDVAEGASADGRAVFKAKWDHDVLVIHVRTDDETLRDGLTTIELFSENGEPAWVTTADGTKLTTLTVPLEFDGVLDGKAGIYGEWMQQVTVERPVVMRLVPPPAPVDRS